MKNKEPTPAEVQVQQNEGTKAAHTGELVFNEVARSAKAAEKARMKDSENE